MPHNQTQYQHTLLISIPLKATGNDPSYTMHQLSYLAQPKQPKLHNNSSGKSQSCPYAYCLCSYAYCLNPDQAIRVLPNSIRVCYAYHFPIRVPPETILRSKFHLPHPYAYCLAPYAYQPSHTRIAQCHTRMTRNQHSQICNGFSATSSIRSNLPRFNSYTKSLLSSYTLHILFNLTKS